MSATAVARPRLGRSDFGRAKLFDQVRMARPLALEMLAEGIEYHERLEEDFIEKVAKLLDDDALRNLHDTGWSERVLSDWTTRFDAARAIGIAIGLMLRPEILLKRASADDT